MSKKIVVILKKPPHGSLFPAEGLRVAVAVSASEAKVVSLGDSVYAFLKGTDMTLYKHHLDFLKETEIPILIDKDSLIEYGLTEDDLINNVKVEERNEILNMIADADAIITF
ncbi:MAG: DsrE family protein [Candidatus Bathyarchaeia archaeon]